MSSIPPMLTPTPMPAFADVESELDPTIVGLGLTDDNDVAAAEFVVLTECRVVGCEELGRADDTESEEVPVNAVGGVTIPGPIAGAPVNANVADAVADDANAVEESTDTDFDCAKANAAAASQLVAFTVSPTGEHTR